MVVLWYRLYFWYIFDFYISSFERSVLTDADATTKRTDDQQGGWSYEVISAAIKAVKGIVGDFETLQELLIFLFATLHGRLESRNIESVCLGGKAVRTPGQEKEIRQFSYSSGQTTLRP
jgi:hypothetical protein